MFSFRAKSAFSLVPDSIEHPHTTYFSKTHYPSNPKSPTTPDQKPQTIEQLSYYEIHSLQEFKIVIEKKGSLNHLIYKSMNFELNDNYNMSVFIDNFKKHKIKSSFQLIAPFNKPCCLTIEIFRKFS